jgi:hypothetical protein
MGASGIITLTGDGLENRSFEVRVFNSMGKTVLSVKDRLILDLSNMETGLYYVSILTSRSEHITKKIILVK